MIQDISLIYKETFFIKDFRASANPLYFRCGILKLCDIVRLNNILLVHDFMHNALPICFENFFIDLKSRYSTLLTKKLCLVWVVCSICYQNFNQLKYCSFKSINIWNKTSKTYNIDLSKLTRIGLKKMATGMFIYELVASDEDSYIRY